MRVLGWRVIGEVPNLPKLVAIAAPHTASMDVIIGIAALLGVGVRVHWLAKRETFQFPIRGLLRALGAVAVDRSAPSSVVRDIMEMMRSQPRFYLGVAPEGTRQKVTKWKTGFYRVAVAAQVPILPVALDYAQKAVVIGTPLMPSGDYVADERQLRAHFHAGQAKYPHRY